MKLLIIHLKKECRDLFFSPLSVLFLSVQSFILGILYSTGLGIAGKPGCTCLNGSEPHACAGAVSLIFGDLFLMPYALGWLILPLILSRLIYRDREHHADLLLAQLGNPVIMVFAKFAAGTLFIAASLIISVPAVFYWHMLGGSIAGKELLLFYSGYLLYGIIIVSISLAVASLSKRQTTGTVVAVLIIMAGLVSNDVLKIFDLMQGVTINDLLAINRSFSQGIFSFRVVVYYLLTSFMALLLAIGRMAAGGGRGKRTAISFVAAVIIIGVPIIAADRNGLFDATYDISASGRKAFWSYASAGSDFVTGNVENVKIVKTAEEITGNVSSLTKKEWPVISAADRHDITVFYCSVFPLLLLFMAAVRVIRYSTLDPGRKRVIVMVGTWIVIMSSAVIVQDFYIRNRDWKVLPSVRDLMPRLVTDINRLLVDDNTQVKKLKSRIDNSGAETNYFYAGDGYRNLQRFFRKLSDLTANRRDTVRIIHYGDSLIWGDCYSKTVKHRLQKEFGDGGRGIVPPVETMATSLQDHINKTPAGGFRLHSIRHEFRYRGGFYVRPDMNRHYGFCGEGTYILSPRSEIRLAVPAGQERWNRIQVFLRSADSMPAETDKIRVNLDYGTGRTERTVMLQNGGLGVAGFDIPSAEKIVINFEGLNRNYPSVDAINVETGRGVAYSTIVRMGIHMSWMNSIPEENLAALRQINPDLVIFQFGINEAASLGAFPEFTEEILRSQMREWLERIKKNLPETDILLIGPPERMQIRQGILGTMKETLAVRRIQREEAKRAGLSFFDTYEALGGEGHMAAMVNTGLAMKDYTHFTMRGGDRAADGFVDSLLNAYRNKSGKPILDPGRGETKPILFNSPAYAYFLIIMLMAGLVLMRWPVARLAFFAMASYYFYATWKVWPLFCLLTTTLTDYGMGLLIKRDRERGGTGTLYLVTSLVINLGILFVLKYFDFFSDMAGKSLHALGYQATVPLLNIMMPVGISFYTFQSLSYTIDVWRGKIEPEKNFFRYAQYVSMFTQLMAGPIVKAREFLPALRDKAVHFTVAQGQFTAAIFLILCGLVKKTGADWLAGSIVDRVYSSPHMFLPLETLTAVYAYGVQIYGDFSGYTDIAIGSAMLLGFNLTENFRRPYASASVSEFWQRWHISLGSWLRDYLYISLGGNRKRVLLNIFITMFLCGLWHGAAIPFIVWGLYHGLFMVLERITGLNENGKVHPAVRVVRVFFTVHIVLFGWIIFRSDSWSTFAGILNSLFRFTPGAPNVGVLLLAVMGLFYAMHFTPLSWKESMKNAWSRMPATLQGAAASAVMIFLYNVAITEVKPFIYFQF